MTCCRRFVTQDGKLLPCSRPDGHAGECLHHDCRWFENRPCPSCQNEIAAMLAATPKEEDP